MSTLSTPAKQEGSALIVSLIILLIMTILGVQGMQSSTLEERMAGNFRDRALAFEAAESALKEAEVWLENQPSPPTTVGDFGDYDFESLDWVNNATLATNNAGSPIPPRYVIELRAVNTESAASNDVEIGSVGNSAIESFVYSYRITARGVGSSPNSLVYLQSNFEKTFLVDEETSTP